MSYSASRLQRKAGPSAKAGVAPSIVHEALRSPGRPLASETLAFMESRLGHDFSQVRVHTDSVAASSARAVDALAYTVGRNVVFSEGRYEPGSGEGRRLLAHELTHVIQQGGEDRALSEPLSVGDKAAAQESEAEAASRTGAPGHFFEPRNRDGLTLRRQEDDINHTGSEHKQFPLASRSGALSYRGSTNLMDCIRIMGPESEDYCRETVLGERAPVIAGLRDPLADMSTFQSPGASGWWGAKFGCYRTNCTKRHQGWDLHASVGTEIFAATTGSVTHHQDLNGYGDYIRLKSKEDPQRQYWYAHLSERKAAGSYSAGSVIGKTGTTGNAQADRPHLDFSVRIGGTPVDPASYFSEPSQVIEATGTSATTIDKSLPAPCVPKC